ncbi:MAG: hypothetical protein ACFFCU_13365 [Promethearchaeota archaeon]
MSPIQNLKCKFRSHKRLIYASFALVILIYSVTSLYYSPDINISVSLPVPRLMKQSYCQDQIKSKVPDYLYSFLSEEDKQTLQQYESYLTHFSDEDIESLEQYDEYLQQLANPNQRTLDAYDYFLNSWTPVEETVTINSDDLPDFKESFQSFFFNDWVKQPSYSLDVTPDQEIESISTADDHKVETTTQIKNENYELIDRRIITENQEIHQRSIITENSEFTQITEISGKPQIRLIEPDFSGFEDIQIPIHSASGGKGASQAQVEYLNKTIDIKLGFEFNLPGFNYKPSLSLFIIRFRAWAVFEAGFHFVFPVRLIIEYPKEVMEGQTYDFKVTLIPLDLPDYHEFEIKFLLDVGVALDAKYLHWTTKRVTVRYWWFWKWRKKKVRIPWFGWTWKNVFSYPLIYYNYHKYDDYQTPLAGENVQVDFNFDVDLLPIIANLNIPYISAICSALSNIMEIGVGLGFLDVYGKAVTGQLAAAAGDSPKTKNPVSWTSSGELNVLEFGIPYEAGEFLGISVDEMIFHASKVIWSPEFFINFKNFKWWIFTLPLKDWIGSLRVPILGINFGEMNLPTLFSYEISASSIISEDVYDFSMDVEEITPETGQGSLATIGTHDQMYQITIQNLAGKSDVVELEVQGLPEGYRATFDRAVPHYSIGSTPTTFYLIVSPPEQIKIPPGEKTFEIIATSQAKRNLKVPNPAINRSATLIIPSMIGYSLNVDLGTETAKIIQVDYGNYIPIAFMGENLGNLNDTIIVNATLYSQDSLLRNWVENFAVDPYGSGSSQYYSGSFNFRYDRTDLYPSPGVYTLDIEAINQREPTLFKRERMALNFSAHFDIETSITPTSTTMFANFESNFTFTVNNTGNTMDNYTLTTTGWDDYISFPKGNKILDLAPNETEEVEIVLKIPDPDIVPATIYDFRISAVSDGSKGTVASSNDVSVKVLEPDYTPPGITYLDTKYSPWGHEYPQSNFDYGPSWQAVDSYPNTYSVYINDTLYTDQDPWSNETPIFVPVTGSRPLPLGIYNITVEFSDTSGNVATDQIWVTIKPTDNTLPIVEEISGSTLPENFARPHTLIWKCTEEYLLDMTIYKNGTKVAVTPETLIIEQDPDTEHTSLITHYISTGSLTAGVWNFTLFIQDAEHNSDSASIFVIIAPSDYEAPSFTGYPEFYAYLNHGETVSFNATDDYPDRYELWVNSIPAKNGTWESGVSVDFQVDELVDLQVGGNNLELKLYDRSNNLISYSWGFSLIDIDEPTLVVSPTDFTVFEHELTQIDAPFWQLHDHDPNLGTFELYRDSILVKAGVWTPTNGTISVPIENLAPGIYTFDAEFRDASDNMRFSTVQVTVKDILAPYVWPHDPIYFEPVYTASWFEFFISEPHLSSYKLFRNGTEIDSKTITSNFPFILVNIEDLKPGYYNFTLVVEDESRNVATELVQVYVTDYTPPYIKRPPDLVFSEGTTGHSIHWEILEANPHNYSLYLNDQLIDSGTLLETNFTITVDTLTLGFHTYLLLVYDEQGSSHSMACHVAVVDITAPTLSKVSDCRFVEGDSNARIVWQAHDIHPSSYTIKLNGSTFLQETWSGDDITLQLVGWSAGAYEIELIISDTSSNVASDEVTITIVSEEQQITSKQPAVSGSGFTLVFVLCGIVVLGLGMRLKKHK